MVSTISIIVMTCLSVQYFTLANLETGVFFPITSLNMGKSYKNSQECYQPVKRCYQLNRSSCLDVSLPYKYSALHSELSSLDDQGVSSSQLMDTIHEYLERWKGLRSIPQCWKALQTLLCASMFPRCENDSLRIILPTYEMCRLTRVNCRLVDQHFEWPEFLNCENGTLFPTECTNQYMDLKFSSTTRCATPMVSTADRRIWYQGFDSCALHCINPIYTEEQHEQMSKLITYGFILSIMLTMFAILTFIIDRSCLKRRFYTLIVFYMNLCLLISSFGWLLQFFKGRKEIVCRADNTTRYGEPSKPDHFYCIMSFILIYFFSFAALIWFVHLFEVFYKTFNGLSTGIKVKYNKFHFHMSAWSIPLIMTIFILLLGEIDGDSLRGICFVGSFKPMVRWIFVFVPLSIGMFIALHHSAKTVFILFKAKQKCTNSIKRKTNIQTALIRIILFTLFIFIIFLVITGSYIYELITYEDNLRHFNDELICSLNVSTVLAEKHPSPPSSSIMSMMINNNQKFSSNHSKDDDYLYMNGMNTCPTYSPPNLTIIFIQTMAIFSINILASSWLWTRATVATWKRFFKRYFDEKKSQSIRLKPYELIANSYMKRDQIQQGLYMPSMQSNHNDPVDMDINSAQSQSLSTNFQQNFSHLFDRRHAICGNDVLNNKKHNILKNGNNFIGSSSFVSQNLSISDVSQQQLSFESHQEQIEMTFRNQRRKSKKERERRRRGSDTSDSIISAAYIASKANKLRNMANKLPQQHKSNTMLNNKTTSTGDLLNMILGQSIGAIPPATAMIHPHQSSLLAAAAANGAYPIAPYPTTMAMMQQAAPAIITPTVTGPQLISTPNTAPVPSCSSQTQQQQQPRTSSPTEQPWQTVRMNKNQYVQSFSFTHGMSDQTGHTIVNPMIEKRRPDSSATIGNEPNGNKIPITECSNLVVSNQNMFVTNENYMLNTAFAMPPASIYSASKVGPGLNGEQYASFVPAANYAGLYTGATAPTTAATYPAAAAANLMAAAAAAAAIPRYYNTQAAFLAFQQSKNMRDIENYMREHDKFKSLITGHFSDQDSGSEMLPIVLTESETSRNGYYSDEQNERKQLQSTKLMVQEHMKRVEEQSQQKPNDDHQKDNQNDSKPEPNSTNENDDKNDPNGTKQ